MEQEVRLSAIMKIRPIRTDKDHRAALAEIEKLWGASIGTPEGDKLDILVTLVETYEERRWPLKGRRRFDPVDVLHYAIDELGHSQVERNDPKVQRKLENPSRPSRTALSCSDKGSLIRRNELMGIPTESDDQGGPAQVA